MSSTHAWSLVERWRFYAKGRGGVSSAQLFDVVCYAECVAVVWCFCKGGLAVE